MSSFDVESLFQSIDIILTQRLNALSYDTTVIATIVDDSDKDKGHYIVSDDTIKFDAYTTDATYKTGEQVRVTVINGDWSQKKFIEGKYSDKETDEKAVTYIPPLGTTLQSNLSQIGQKSKWTLYTNGETYAKDPFVITIPEDSDLFNLQNKGIYDVLTIAADISTNLGNLSAGNYGLRLDLLITPESGSEYRIQKFITFDSSEMLGNPYNFIIDSHQEKRIAIADLGHVTEIILTPYQGVVIADDGTEAPAPFLDREGKPIEQLPIYFKNVVLGFGSDLAMLEDNSLKLYTPDLPFYDYNDSFGSSANHKRLGLIWCNKTETNEYIGFSDGIVDIDDDGNIVPYDEIEYLKASNFDERLVAQTNKVGIPSDKTSLTLAANITDAVPLMKSAYENLTTGLSQVLQRFNGQIAGATSIQEKLKPLIFQYKDGDTQYPPKLVQFKDAAKEKATLLEELYTNILQYGYNTEKGLTPNDWNENWGNIDYYILFKSIISEALGEVAAFLNFAKEETATGKVLSGYRRIYNDYEPKINAQIKLINTYIDQISIDADASTGDLAILKSYQTKTDYAPYVKEDFSEYANRYCIYWYRYNEGYKLEYIPPMSESEWNNNKTEHSDYQAYLDYCENNNIEYKYRNFLGDNWERLTIAYDLNEVDAVVNPRPLINFGLPNTVGETVAAVTYFPPAPAESQILTRWLDPCTVDEKYQAVLFYNHEMVKSNIVVFTNSEEVPPRFKVNAGDVLRIEHDIDSREHYQVYSSANDLLNISDGSKTRQLKCFYDGVLTGDETLADAEIYWYIPVNSTMLTYDKKFLVEKQGFSTDVDGKTPYSKDGYVYFNKKIGYTRTEEIMTDEDGNEMYDSNGIALRETVITIDSEDRFFFYKIKSFYESSAQNNTILVYAYVPNKEEPTVGEINFTFGTFGSNGTKYTLAITPATDQIAVLPAANTGDDSGNLQLNLTLYNANSEKLDMTTGMGDSTGYYNLTAEWYASSTNAPALGEIKNIENSKSKSIEALGVLNTNYDTNKYAGIIKASVNYQGAGVNEATDRVITLSALYSVPYASSEDLYISGPTSIIYNSQGTVSRLSEEPYCLYQHTKDGDIKLENQNWSLIYYDNDGDLINSDYRDYQQILAFLPKLAEDNTLIPSPLYCDYGDNLFYIPVAVCKVNNNIVWTQPVIIAQNAYESSMLNDWDGSLQINKENGTVMATMVGAGVKNSDNTFSGVLMGDIVAGADFDSRNANGLGLYGFHHGDQSFHFGVDGTAFLGKAGSGRINFDGNKGTIKSGSYDVDGASGMLIDLDDALIHMRGANSEIRLNALASGYTPYFQITSPKTNNSLTKNSLIFISDSNYYLQSSNFNDEEGMHIDLDSGRIISYNFRLDAWQNNSGIQMDSGGSPYYFKVGADESNYISLNRNMLDIKATNFELDAWVPSGDFETGEGIYINSSGLPYYFKVGSSVDNYISLGSSGLDIKTNQFVLNAWTNDGGIYINSSPTIAEEEAKLSDYFLKVGTDGLNLISLCNGKEGLTIKTQRLLVNAWENNEGIYFDSVPAETKSKAYLRLGKETGDPTTNNYIQLKVDEEGNNGILDISTNNFNLYTPTLEIKGKTEDNEAFFQIRTGEPIADSPVGKILAHISKKEIYLQSENFAEEDNNDGLRIDVVKKEIKFGKATLAFQTFNTTSLGNSETRLSLELNKDSGDSTIALLVRPKIATRTVYVTAGIMGGDNMAHSPSASFTSINMSKTSGVKTINDNEFPKFEIMDSEPAYTYWRIDRFGYCRGFKLFNPILYGQIYIPSSSATDASGDVSSDPFFRCMATAYIGQIKIDQNNIYNEYGDKLNDAGTDFAYPINFMSPTIFKKVTKFEGKVDFLENTDLTYNTTLKINKQISIYRVADDDDSTVNLYAKEWSGYNPCTGKPIYVTNPEPCLHITNHAAVSGVFYADAINTGSIYICKNRIAVHLFNDPWEKTILSFSSTGLDAYGDITFNNFSTNSNNTVSFNSGVNFAAGQSVNFNGGVTFHTNPAVIRDGTPKTLGELAFADSVKKKLNITMTANNVSGYYKKSSSSDTTYRYKGTFSDSAYYSGSGTVLNVSYPASETGGTMDVPYSYSGWVDYNYDVYEEYDPYSAVTSITMTGTTTPEFFASTDTTNSEEDITIAGTISS